MNLFNQYVNGKYIEKFQVFLFFILRYGTI